MVFQDPLTSLHPMLSIGRQLTEHVRFHEGLRRKAADARARELLEQVRIPDPEGTLHAFPHQFSGGMRQRIAIAVALACRPKLLIADEPTTALDVTVQAGILRLLDTLRTETGLSVILITHDLGVMSSIADSVSVFYAGRIVESGATARGARAAAAPVHARAARRAPAPRGLRRPRARRDRRHAADAGRAPDRLRVPPALRVRAAELRRARAAARADRRRSTARVSDRPVRHPHEPARPAATSRSCTGGTDATRCAPSPARP